MRSRACKCCPNVLAFNGSHTLDQHAITPGAASSTDSMPVISFFFFCNCNFINENDLHKMYTFGDTKNCNQNESLNSSLGHGRLSCLSNCQYGENS